MAGLFFRPKEGVSGTRLTGDNTRIVLLASVAALYIELFLIRWIGTEVRVFAYVQNLALIACFLGFGVGCFQAGKPSSLMPTLYVLVLLALIVTVQLEQWQNFLTLLSEALTLSPDAALWGSLDNANTFATHSLLSVFAILIVATMLWLIAESMIPFGQLIGACFEGTPNVIRTYSVNLLGSLIGAWLLVGLSFYRLSPACWFAVAFILILCAMPHALKYWMAGLFFLPFIMLLLLNSEPSQSQFWSPYQKLSLQPDDAESNYTILVNNTGYMSMANVTPEYLRKHPDFAAKYKESVYDSPFRFVPQGANVLIIGAGAGNDASAALRNGAAHVDAVEIDPVIYALGKALHPDHPYDSDKVHVIINDARNYLRRSDARYDAVIFGLLDSHTEFSGYSNMRVDNYVYTKESFEQASRLLKTDGVLIVKFEVRDPWTWIGQRFYRTLAEVFGRPPLVFYAPTMGHFLPGTVFIESRGSTLWNKAQQPALRDFIARHPPVFKPDVSKAPPIATDDWPYPYHHFHSIPRTYLVVSGILLCIAFLMARHSFAIDSRQTWVMFFLGAGFMLMETQLINRLTLYFGTTWIVSSIAVSMVLIVLVLANLFVDAMKPVDCLPYYVILLASLILNYCFPWETLPYAPWCTGLLLSGAYAVAVLMAGIIFTTMLRKSEEKANALGANIMGATVGGLSQNLSFIFGLKALLLLAAASYLASIPFNARLRS